MYMKQKVNESRDRRKERCNTDNILGYANRLRGRKKGNKDGRTGHSDVPPPCAVCASAAL